MTRRRRARRAIMRWFAAAGGVAITSCGAFAQPLTPAQLAPAIDAVVEGKIEERALLLGCAANDAQLRDVVTNGWRNMRTTLSALLWAADFPGDHVRGVIARTDPEKMPPLASEKSPSCDQPVFAARREEFGVETWSNELRAMFKALQLPYALLPPNSEQWARVKASVAREAPAQEKMLNCMAVTGADFLPLALMDWARAVGDSRTMLEAGGYPRDEIAVLFDPIAPGALYKPAADRAAMREACAKDRDWRDRYATFSSGAIFFDIREIVTGKR